jgi:hypothetical protein
MEVGRVKSEKDEFTEVAIARQRALIAEHAKRLYLVQVSVYVVEIVEVLSYYTCSLTETSYTIQQTTDTTQCQPRVGLSKPI